MFKDIFGPLEKKHIRLKNAFFINNTSSKEIMRKTKLRNKFFDSRSEENQRDNKVTK